MNWTELCVSSRANQLRRWQQAFPEGKIFWSSQQMLPFLRSDSVVWLHAEAHPENQLSEAIATIRGTAAAVRLVVISCTPNPVEALAVFAAGAAGYCHALATPDMLQQVALVVRNGGMWVGPEVMNRLIGAIGKIPLGSAPPGDATVLDQLTAREQAVALQVGAGASNKEIAQVLGITERTVKAHLSSIFEKLGIRDRLQLALLLSNGDPDRDANLPRATAAP